MAGFWDAFGRSAVPAMQQSGQAAANRLLRQEEREHEKSLADQRQQGQMALQNLIGQQADQRQQSGFTHDLNIFSKKTEADISAQAREHQNRMAQLAKQYEYDTTLRDKAIKAENDRFDRRLTFEGAAQRWAQEYQKGNLDVARQNANTMQDKVKQEIEVMKRNPQVPPQMVEQALMLLGAAEDMDDEDPNRAVLLGIAYSVMSRTMENYAGTGTGFDRDRPRSAEGESTAPATPSEPAVQAAPDGAAGRITSPPPQQDPAGPVFLGGSRFNPQFKGQFKGHPLLDWIKQNMNIQWKAPYYDPNKPWSN